MKYRLACWLAAGLALAGTACSDDADTTDDDQNGGNGGAGGGGATGGGGTGGQEPACNDQSATPLLSFSTPPESGDLVTARFTREFVVATLSEGQTFENMLEDLHVGAFGWDGAQHGEQFFEDLNSNVVAMAFRGDAAVVLTEGLLGATDRSLAISSSGQLLSSPSSMTSMQESRLIDVVPTDTGFFVAWMRLDATATLVGRYLDANGAHTGSEFDLLVDPDTNSHALCSDATGVFLADRDGEDTVHGIFLPPGSTEPHTFDIIPDTSYAGSLSCAGNGAGSYLLGVDRFLYRVTADAPATSVGEVDRIRRVLALPNGGYVVLSRDEESTTARLTRFDGDGAQLADRTFTWDPNRYLEDAIVVDNQVRLIWQTLDFALTRETLCVPAAD